MKIKDIMLMAAADEIQFGIYACSPEESSFTALFYHYPAAGRRELSRHTR